MSCRRAFIAPAVTAAGSFGRCPAGIRCPTGWRSGTESLQPGWGSPELDGHGPGASAHDGGDEVALEVAALAVTFVVVVAKDPEDVPGVAGLDIDVVHGFRSARMERRLAEGPCQAT